MNKVASRFVGLMTVLGIAAWSLPGFADPVTEDNLDPLYAFCYGGSSCADNGKITPTVPSNPLQFGFYILPPPNTGDFSIDILIPNNEDADPSSLSFAITGTQGGSRNNASISATANLVSGNAWTHAPLMTFLDLTIAPNGPVNRIANWLPLTQAYDPGATGYYVYQADLGINELRGANNELLGPLLSLDQPLPAGALIVGDLDTSAGVIATYLTGALLVDSPEPAPEPGSLAIFGVALLSLAAAYRGKRS